MGGTAYGAGRLVDRTLGLASPTHSFVEKFSDPTVPVRTPASIAQGLAQQAAALAQVRQQMTGNPGNPAVPQVAMVPAVAPVPQGASASAAPQAGAGSSPAAPPTNTVQNLVKQAQVAGALRRAMAPAPTEAPASPVLVERITKANGKTQEHGSSASPDAVQEVPTPEGLLHTQINSMDHQIAQLATDQFKASVNVPPVVASRYYNSTTQRQARIRDRLQAISGDPRFPSNDVTLGEALDQIRHVRSREALAAHVADIEKTVKPEVAAVIRAYFGPTWAKSVWNPSK
jgi:hypothetical protein